MTAMVAAALVAIVVLLFLIAKVLWRVADELEGIRKTLEILNRK